MHPPAHRPRSCTSCWHTTSRISTFPDQPPQPPRCTSPGLQYAAASSLLTPNAPPPEVSHDSTGYCLGCGGGTTHKKVHADHEVWEVFRWESEEAHKGRLSAWRSECGGEVGEGNEKRAREEVGRREWSTYNLAFEVIRRC